MRIARIRPRIPITPYLAFIAPVNLIGPGNVVGELDVLDAAQRLHVAFA